MRVLITGGPTHEHWDDVRFLGNAASGRMGFSMALAAQSRGHEAVLVLGPTLLTPPAGIFAVVNVTSAREMHAAARAMWDDCHALVATAAVCDYRPAERIDGKRTKGERAVTLELTRNPDILASLASTKGDRVCIGFALQVDDALEHARRKLREKHLDVIVIDGPDEIGSVDGAFRILGADDELTDASGSKDALADRLMTLIEGLSAR